MKPRVVVTLTLVLCGLLGGLGTRTARANLPTPALAAPSVSRSAANGASAAEDIRDIHGPIAGPGRGHLWWYVGGAGALLAMAGGLAGYARRRKPPLPPHERALQALAVLEASPADDARLFSFAVSEIVRVYVEEAFHVRAAHRTTEELLADLLMDTSPLASHRVAVGEFLRHCDLAKFGGWALSPADMAALLASAETLVRATTPTPPRKHARRAPVHSEGVA